MVVSRPKVTYDITDAATGAVLGQHRTRQAAIDNWRVGYTGIPVKIIRRRRRGEPNDILIVEGTWHEAFRPDGV